MNALWPYRLTNLLLALGVVFCGTSVAWAAQPATRPQAAVLDAELGPNGVWTGTVVSVEGIPMAGARLELVSGDPRRPAVSTATDENGHFRFEQVHAGLYTLRCGTHARICRLWHFGTAPPAAGKGSLIVVGGAVTRGNLYDWAAAHPVLTYTGIAAAIVVPVAVIGSAQDKSPASP